MCLINVKEEEEFSSPARVRKVRAIRRYSPSPPPREREVRRVSRVSIVQERRPSPSPIRHAPSRAPSRAPSTRIVVPSRAPSPPPAARTVYSSREPSLAPAAPTIHSSRAPSLAPAAPTVFSSRAPSIHPAATTVHSSRAPSLAPTAPTVHSTRIEKSVHGSRVGSRPSSRAPSTRDHFVEVTPHPEPDTSSSSSSSSDEDVKSRHTHKSATTHRSSHTRKSSASSRPPPPRSVAATEYSMHEREKEIRREFSRPRSEFETYRYVPAPDEPRRSLSRRSGHDDPRTSRDSYRRVQEIIHEDDRESRRSSHR